MNAIVIKRCRLEELLLEKDWNNKYLSKITGISETQISLYIKNKRIMTLGNAWVIATALGCKIEDLYEFRNIFN